MKNLFITLITTLLFMNVSAQSITVVNPNGGEVLSSCQNYIIKWNTAGTLSNYYDISYSLDGGTIWASVATNYLSTNGQYSWTVPNVQSSTCLIRVRDAQNNTITDQSNAMFTINIPITVLSPNGGETVQGGDTRTITWNALGTSNTFNLYYSINGGSTWTTIATNYSTASGTYNWLVPNIPSTNVLIRVRDYVTSCMQDESNAPFTIIADDPVLLTPNGAETWYPGCSYNITWNAATLYTNVMLEYSTNNGSTWTTILASTSNDGTETWTVPYQLSSTCLIRISNVGAPAIKDVSDATFSIVAPIRVISANGGETWNGCSTYNISWAKPGTCIDRFSIQYSTDNGANWTSIITNLQGISGSLQSYAWTVPNGISSSEALIKVIDFYNSATVFDVSNTTFTIAPSNDITVTAPNGGETFNGLGTATITWTNLPTASGQYNLFYSTNGGSSWTTIASGITGNAYIWNVPNNPSTNCRIRVQDAVNTCKLDASDASFTILAATPLLLSPNGGEIVNAGCPYSITWYTATFYTNVRIDYSADGGTTWTNIITSTSNDGEHSWTAPYVFGTNYKIKISNTSDLLTTDISDAPFTVRNPITVTAANGGETWNGCSTYNISWTKPGTCIDRFSIQYSTDNGANWTSIITNLQGTSGSFQSYAWTVPNGISSAQALIKVIDFYNSATVFDVSNAPFNIAPSNDITVTAPNGGETFNGLGTATITWTNLPTASGQYNIHYSTNGGSGWTTIASGITGNAYIWNVPNNPSTNCRIRVQDAVNTCKLDQSDAVFTINPPLPVLLSPNGGEIVNAGCPYSITWNTATFYSNVRIDYSADGGTTWNNITTSTSNDGEHSWTAPYVFGTDYKIKIANTSDLLTTDISDAPFTVRNPIRVISANGGETWNGCSTYNISWAKPGTCIDRFSIQYSTDNGANWTSIITNLQGISGSFQSYAWTVPNGISSSEALIKVIDFYNSATVFDVSNTTFTIAPSNDITVTAPNGGETFNGLGTANITWTNLPTASGQYNIHYSTNGGSSWTTIASGITGNAYIWNVPNNPSTNCRIRVQDAVNTCKLDASDASFTILAATPLLLSPNSGEIFNAGCPYSITWNTATFYTNVRIDYSADGGTTWTNIITSTSNDGEHSWTAPYVFGTNYKIKISNTSDLLTTDISDAPFTVRNPITVTAANGGETWNGCSTYNISWTKPGTCIDRFSIQYSTDNGANWTSIITNLQGTSGSFQSYAWTVPNGISSSEALIKVIDFYNSATVFDVSNAPFNIAPSNDITVTAPNGGEIFNGLGTTTITWTNLPTASGQYNIHYSTNGGSGWTTIASGITGNAYTWNIPNAPSTNCRIRVQDAVNTCKLDASDASFTINPPLPVLLSPNGGEIVNAGCPYSITWNTATFYTNVRIDFSADGGTTWTNITTSTANDGEQSWTAPLVFGTNYKIKIANTSDLLTTDISDAPFTVRNPVRVISANGGETWNGCSTYNITWAKPGTCIDRFSIQYSTDNGANWTSIITNLQGISGSFQSYAWTVPNGISSSEALIKVIDFYNSATVFDVSNAPFNIAPSNDITVTAPNGGETIQGLNPVTITWTNLPTASGQYNIHYSTNGGSSWTTIASNVSGNSYVWTTPNIPSTQYLIRVQDYVNTCKFDASDAVFTITPATPILWTPNGGESIYAASTYNITWNAATYYSNVRIDYSTDNGFTWNTITTSTSNDGTESWTVPNTPSTQCLVRVSNTSNLSVNDVSNATFTIKPAVRIITPNGDDGITNWGGCTVTSITFDHTPAYTSWNILYSLNGGTTWTTVASNWAQAANPATYNWTIPNTSSSNVLVKAEPTANTAHADQSDAPFTVTKPVTIVQPNFGGIMQVGSVYNISWSSDGISNIYDIFFSSNGGTTWTPIVIGYNTSTNTYPWTVPNAASGNCLIRVRDNISNCKEHVSDIPFTISASAPALTVLSPNGGETWSGCTAHPITWTASSPSGTYDLSYSTNSGTTWVPIATNYATSALSYNWVVPNLNSSTVLVKVKASGTAIEDLSNALFSLQSGNLVITTNDTTVCTGSPVQLNATGAASYTWTPTAGLSNPNIANPVATPAATTTYTVQYINGGCAMQDQVTITANSTGSLPVSVSIAASATVICSSTSVTFTATPVNGGTTPSYQWKVNGVNAGTNNSVFTSSTLSNNDAVTVVLTSNATCVSGNPATSNVVTMNVSATSTPSVSISASASNICAGTSVTFTATPVNGGSSPVYTWKVGGVSAGTNAAAFTSSSLTHGAVVTVTIASNSGCAVGGPVTSSGITMTVNSAPAQPAAISGPATVCVATSQTYSVVAVPGATSYTWTLPSGWTGTSTSNSIQVLSGSAGGTISVTASNSCGVSTVRSIPVQVYTVPNVVANSTANAICPGTPVTLYGTGATSYTWTGASNGVAFTPALTATYTVTGTDVNGCTDTDMITVIVNTAPSVVANATSTNLCGGGAVTLTGSGASTYTWNNGVSNGVAFTPSTTRTYTVTGTATNGCTNISQVTVAVNSLPSVNAGPDQTVCANTPVTLSGSGASSYVWNNGVTNGTPFNASATTTYTVTGTDANGCTNTDQVIVTVKTLPTVVANASTTTACIGGTVTLTGSGANTYLWNNGVTNGVSFSPSATQTYTVTGTATNGCSSTGQVTVSVNSLPGVTANATAVSVCPGTPVTLTGSGANNYTWNNSVLNGVAFTPATTATYTVTGTNSNGCINTAQITVNVLPVPTVNAGADQTVCQGASVTLNASGAASYLWNNGVTNAVSFTAGATTTYTVTGTGANGCKATDQVTVTVNNAPVVSASGVPTTVCQGTSVILSGSGANTYAWNHGVSNGVAFVPSSTQTYTVTGTSTNGCTDTEQITITVNALPTVVASATSTSVCAGSPVTLTGSGAVNYSWNNGVLNGVAFTPASTQTYTVTGTSATGCVNTAQVTVTVNNAPVITATGGGTICAGSSATLNATGGAIYTWNNGAGTGASVTVSPTASTVYTVTGTNLNGCTATGQVAVTVANAPVLTASADATICAGNSTTLTVSGASSYTWNNGAGTGASVNVSPTSTTTYTVTGTNAAGCSATAQITVTVNNNPVISATGGGTICTGSSATLNATGAAIYNWNNGAGTGASVTVSPATSTIYTVTGTSLNGCTATGQVAVTVSGAPVLTTSANATICAGNSTTLTVSGATSYTWNNGAGTGASVTVSPASTTTYTVTGTNPGGCTASAQITVTVNTLPNILASGTASVCAGESVTLTATGGTSYSWNNGAGTGSNVTVTPTGNTTYIVTGTNANGCTNTDEVTVNVLPAPVPSVTISSNQLQTGTYASYQWYVNNTAIPGATTQTWNFTENGNYYVKVTDGNGCNGMSVVTTVATASLDEQEADVMNIYPNPAAGFATVDFGKLQGMKTVQLIDLAGKIVMVASSAEQQLQLELNVATGYYQVVVTTSDEVIHLAKRLMVQ